jgi:Fe2+ or Zn2+ uptake regulation protein
VTPPPSISIGSGPRAKALGQRDLIVNVFLRQEGHLSADDLVELIRHEDHRISRATVYRTLQWMVDAGIAARWTSARADSGSSTRIGTRAISI